MKKIVFTIIISLFAFGCYESAEEELMDIESEVFVDTVIQESDSETQVEEESDSFIEEDSETESEECINGTSRCLFGEWTQTWKYYHICVNNKWVFYTCQGSTECVEQEDASIICK